MRNRAVGALAAVLALAAFTGLQAADQTKQAGEARQFREGLPQDERIRQALNRLTFGPRPGDVEAVRAVGLRKWIDLQLHPGEIAENPVLEDKLKYFDTLSMSGAELVRNYPTPQIARQMMAGRIPFPEDPGRRLLLTKMMEKYEKRQAAGGDPNAAGKPGAPDVQALSEIVTPGEARALRQGTPRDRMQALLALPPDVRRRVEMAAGPQQVIARDLMEAKLLRAVYSNRQLEEVLTDFWFNHFNVFLDKGADRYLVTSYERDAIRPHVLGRFRDLLEATAKSPAMLFYLDNWQSEGANSVAAGRGGRKGGRGLNENYGRELMELHTLGVDGGYTQKDVTEVARCFTGWTIRNPQRGGEFVFDPRMHDAGAKTVLGVTIPAGGGIEDGERVLDILARNPATARYLSRKLAMRFVADDPPEVLVERMARTFVKTDGDLRAVLRAMIESKEFFSAGAYRSKMKSPLEFVASAVRAINGDVEGALPLAMQVAQLGQPLYRKQEPTGYSNASAEWMNSGGLVGRMNFAVQLADNKVPGVKVDPEQAARPGGVPAGIELGSPAFQKH
ncbi:MAG: DUF1800 domain-containing protein [Acidobacteriota bacterium]|nr:DUF1800 domain-containing protein [Acidobacteriota bacterium]